MTDITPAFNAILAQKGSPLVERRAYDLQRINAFLQEAHRIHAGIADLHRELRAIRPAYLSTAPAQRRRHAAPATATAVPTPKSTNTAAAAASAQPRARPLTDAERDALDAQAKALLRQLHGAITGLAQAEEVRNQTADSVALSRRARGGLGALGRWAAGGAVTAKSVAEAQEEAARQSVAAHRESVLLLLRLRLERASRVQSEMMDVRLARELEKSKSILAKSPVAAGGGGGAAAAGQARGLAETLRREDEEKDGVGVGGSTTAAAAARPELSPEQLQVFAEENHELLKHYEDQLDQVRTAEKSILEISELHTTLHANLQQQSENIDQLVQDSYLTTENLGKGNKELKKASERRSTARLVFLSTVAFCSFLVVWDLVF